MLGRWSPGVGVHKATKTHARPTARQMNSLRLFDRRILDNSLQIRFSIKNTRGASNTSTKRQRVSLLPLSRLTRWRFVLAFPMAGPRRRAVNLLGRRTYVNLIDENNLLPGTLCGFLKVC